MGLEYGQAQNLSLDAGRSLAVLRRLMPAAPGSRPSWSIPQPPRPMLGALLAGGWLETLDGDKAVIEQLAGVPYEEAVRALGPYATALDGPLRKR
jgi:anti-sigma factor RsiW